MNYKISLKSILLCGVVIMLVLTPSWGWAQSSPHYAEEWGWYFDNFTTNTNQNPLSWELFRETYIGIPPEPVGQGKPIQAFFNNVFQLMPQQGHCVGMCVFSLLIRKNGAFDGFCPPLSQYASHPNQDGPQNDLLRRTMHRFQCHQMNIKVLKHYGDVLARGKIRDGNHAYDQYQYFKSRDDAVIAQLSNSLVPSTNTGAHAVVAYRAEDRQNEKRIYVYDPNRTWSNSSDRQFYQNDENYIRIQNNGVWSFNMGGSDVWSGTPSISFGGNVINPEGGYCVMVPLSVYDTKGRAAGTQGLADLNLLNRWIIAGKDASLKQSTSSDGKKLLTPDGKSFETDPNKGMLNTIPWIPSDQAEGNNSPGVATFISLNNRYPDQRMEIQSGGEGYRLDIIGNRGVICVETFGGEIGIDPVVVKNIGTQSPMVQISNNIGADSINITLTQIRELGNEVRTFNVTDLSTQSDIPIHFKINPDLSALEVSANEVPIQYNLELLRITADGMNRVEIPELQVNAGQLQTIQPSDWNNLNLDNILINLNNVDFSDIDIHF